MKRLALLVLAVFLWGCSGGVVYQPKIAPDAIIEKVKAHTVSIATYYSLTQEEYDSFLKERYKKKNNRWQQIIVPLKKIEKHIFVAHIGAGTILKDNHVLTVRHLFRSDYGELKSIWVFKEGLDHVVKAQLVAISDGEKDWDDYAVIKLDEDLGLPGLTIAEPGSVKVGERVIYSGSVGGMAFFTRFGQITSFQHFFRQDDEGRLHLSHWNEFPYLTIYPSGPGDSGGAIQNAQGHVIGVIYCGINVYEEQYAFSNPTKMLWDFLKQHSLEWLGK